MKKNDLNDGFQVLKAYIKFGFSAVTAVVARRGARNELLTKNQIFLNFYIKRL